MQPKADRREAIRKFKEQKPLTGAFALRCPAAGRIWVGAARNLEATRNRYWFCLRHGDHPDREVQQEWNTHGEAAFTYEILETIDELPPLGIADLLKEKKAEWVARLGATAMKVD